MLVFSSLLLLRPALLRWARLGGLWRSLALTLRWAGPRHFCSGVGPCSGPALTTRGRHAQRLVCPAPGHETVSETGHFCAGHMIPVCLALTLRWAETRPLLRWARVPLLCPYLALGLDFAALRLMHLPGSHSLAPSSRAATSLLRRSLSLYQRLNQAEKPEPCPFLLGARLPASSLRWPRACPGLVAHPCPGARDVSIARPTLALRVLALVRSPRRAWRAMLR